MKKLVLLLSVGVVGITMLSGCMVYKSHNQRISGGKAVVPVSSISYIPSSSYDSGYYGNQNWRLDGYCHNASGWRITCPGAPTDSGFLIPIQVPVVAGTGVDGKKTSKLTPEKYMGSKIIPLSCKTGDAGKDGGCITSLAEKLGKEQESCAAGGLCPKDYDPSKWQKAKEALASLGEELSDQ